MLKQKQRLWAALALWAVFSSPNRALRAEIRKIQDNSFLLEEAYNQEEGVIQHIQYFQYMKDKTWVYAFTQEWPVQGQRHQLSYTIPGLRTGGTAEAGLGDFFINYRHQTVLKGPLAVAPRLSLLLPSGDYKRGLGSGSVGLQSNIPISVEFRERWVSHWNLGATYIPNAKATDGSRTGIKGFNYGASVICLVNDKFNLMLESVGTRSQSVISNGAVKAEKSFFLNPGMRYAFDFKSGLQVVVGVSFPVGLAPSSGEYGSLLYLSFEHPLKKKNAGS